MLVSLVPQNGRAHRYFNQYEESTGMEHKNNWKLLILLAKSPVLGTPLVGKQYGDLIWLGLLSPLRPPPESHTYLCLYQITTVLKSSHTSRSVWNSFLRKVPSSKFLKTLLKRHLHRDLLRKCSLYFASPYSAVFHPQTHTRYGQLDNVFAH